MIVVGNKEIVVFINLLIAMADVSSFVGLDIIPPFTPRTNCKCLLVPGSCLIHCVF